jgi:hypothetical protein
VLARQEAGPFLRADLTGGLGNRPTSAAQSRPLLGRILSSSFFISPPRRPRVIRRCPEPEAFQFAFSMPIST